jgi:hypothetical protein
MASQVVTTDRMVLADTKAARRTVGAVIRVVPRTVAAAVRVVATVIVPVVHAQPVDHVRGKRTLRALAGVLPVPIVLRPNAQLGAKTGLALRLIVLSAQPLVIALSDRLLVIDRSLLIATDHRIVLRMVIARSLPIAAIVAIDLPSLAEVTAHRLLIVVTVLLLLNALIVLRTVIVRNLGIARPVRHLVIAQPRPTVLAVSVRRMRIELVALSVLPMATVTAQLRRQNRLVSPHGVLIAVLVMIVRFVKIVRHVRTVLSVRIVRLGKRARLLELVRPLGSTVKLR